MLTKGGWVRNVQTFADVIINIEMVLKTYCLKKYKNIRGPFLSASLIDFNHYMLAQFGRKPIVKLWLNFEDIEKSLYRVSLESSFRFLS